MTELRPDRKQEAVASVSIGSVTPSPFDKQIARRA